MPETPVGKVEHYYPKVKAAAVRLTKRVKVGDEVHIVGHGDDVKEKVTSLQLDHEPIQEGAPGQSVGLWVKDRVHEGDDVLLVTPDAAWSKPQARTAKAKAAKPAKKARTSKAKPRKAKARTAKKAGARKAKVAHKPARKAARKKAKPSRKKR
jgi:translation elongation factor EF-1alpha